MNSYEKYQYILRHIKRGFFYLLARQRALFAWRKNPRLSNVGLKSKAVTQADFESEWFQYWWSRLLGSTPFIYHRKYWEYCYLAQALWEGGMLTKGRRGLGFACGGEPMPSFFASLAIDVTATDLPMDKTAARTWIETNQYMLSRQNIWKPEIVSETLFSRHCSIDYVDMNYIPLTLSGYDFCWSLCAFEHLGSISKGLDFVENSLKTLRPGGVAVHTSELQISRQKDNFESTDLVLFKRENYTALAEKLTLAGHTVMPLDFNLGTGCLDKYVDFPHKPLTHAYCHLKYALPPYETTSFGIIVIKNN